MVSVANQVLKLPSLRPSFRYWVRSSITLTTIMGLTWVVGFLVFDVPALLPLAYIFTIFAAFQGVVIFVIFVPLSKQVRDAYSKWWRVKAAQSDILSKHFGEWSFTKGNTSVSTKLFQQKLTLLFSGHA